MEARIEHRSGFVVSGGEDIYFESSGPPDAPVIVLCHGLGGNHAAWYQQVASFADRFHVVTWDQRGFGRSTRRSDVIGPEPAATDLGALLEHLEIERAHVVGQSMGGWCALGFTLANPQRVVSLVLADSLGGIMSPEVRDALIAHHRGEGFAPTGSLVGVHPAIAGLSGRNLAHAFLYQQLSSFGAQMASDDMIPLMMSIQHGAEDLERLTAPVLVLFGEHDQLLPPPALRVAASMFPRAEVAEIPGCAHSPYFEDAPAWNAAVSRFLEGQATD